MNISIEKMTENIKLQISSGENINKIPADNKYYIKISKTDDILKILKKRRKKK